MRSDGESSVRHADFRVSIGHPVEMSNEKLNLELRDLSVWKYLGIFSLKVLIMAMDVG